MERRDFIKLLFAAPAIKCIDVISPSRKNEMPKALLVDPYLVSMRDLKELGPIYPGKVIRVRRPYWGTGEPITKIF
ncbi:unnamed protein product [marine sediment metagenome]|uniref:Uncharacterized protein n=1 Tax=marine sediment metagenome TaxID=412755 RepID=X0TR61_9ZZZZ